MSSIAVGMTWIAVIAAGAFFAWLLSRSGD